jgi:urease beta subunit
VISLLLTFSSQVFAIVTISPPGGVNYGEFQVGTTSGAANLTVLNRGDVPVQLGTVDVFGEVVTVIDDLGNVSTYRDSGTDFITVNNGCSNVELGVLPSASARCKLSVSFSPRAEGARTGALIVNSNANDSPVVQARLSGVGTVTTAPKIDVSPTTVDFGEIHVNDSTDSYVITVSNMGSAPLKLGQASFQSNEFFMSYDCSNQTLAPSSACTFIMGLQPMQAGDKVDTLTIASNDPDNPKVAVTLTGKALAWCQRYETGFYLYPNSADFGSETVGKTLSVQQYFGSWARGCDAREVTTIAFTGTNAEEFSVENKNCYNSYWEDYSYSSCSFTSVFSPKTEGTKQANLVVTYNDAKTETINATGTAITDPQPNMTVTPTVHDFGSATVNTFDYSNGKNAIVKNTGNTNLTIPYFYSYSNSSSAAINGTDADSFLGWGCYSYDGNSYWSGNGIVLKPGKECQIYTGFSPRSVGAKQATLNITSEAPAVSITLTGTGEPAVDCSDANITIESVSSGPWAIISTETNGTDSYPYYYGNGYYTASNAWKRLKNTDKPNYPMANDVVRIKSGHTISGLPYATVRALCIEVNGTLESSTAQSYAYYYPYLAINATDAIENKGTIKGLNGGDETSGCNATDHWAIWGTQGCAQPGASVYLGVGNWMGGGNFRNEGTVISGHGGSGVRYGASGGGIYIYAGGVANTDDVGFIDAGKGGNITGTASGRAGDGGFVNVWGNDFLNSDGRGIYAGNGGNCNPAATEAQMGGNGGGMRLNARNNVSLEGSFATGKGGKNCTPLGTNGQDGGFNTDPSVLSISGANTKIEGGDITIYGGEDWVMNLSGLSEKAITATGDITLAVGKGGAINLTGNTGKILEAAGQVNLFTDSLLIDQGVQLSDIISAGSITVAPAKIMRDVTVTAPQLLSGEEGTNLAATITLSNGSPEADTFLFSVTDTAGWPISQLPTSVEVEALSSVELELNIQLPNASGVSDLISVTAISKADLSVKSVAKIRVSSGFLSTQVSSGNNTGGTGGSGAGSAVNLCSSSGMIDAQCSNHGQTIRDARIEANGILSGGNLSGTVENRGLISQVTIEAGAILKGGRLSGFITNLGTITDVEFRGGGVSGGILAGKISNTGSILSLFKDVKLAADTQLQGVELEGEIAGDAYKPALLENLKIRSGTRLKGVIIGSNVQFGTNIVFGLGVRFRRVEDIPTTLDLTAILPKVIPTLCGSDAIQPESLDLTTDVIADSTGLIAAINALPELKNNKWVLHQDADNGTIYLDVDSVRFAVQPRRLTRSTKGARLHVGVGTSVEFTTANNMEIFSTPALQAPCALREALQLLKFSQMTITEDGNIQVPIPDSQKYYSARPDLAASEVKDEAEVGLFATKAPVFIVFSDKAGKKKRRQVLYAAPADRVALLATATDMSLDAEGILELTIGGKHYRGQLDYVVTRGDTTGKDSVTIAEIADKNQDGVKDFLLTYPNGDQQIVYALSE